MENLYDRYSERVKSRMMNGKTYSEFYNVTTELKKVEGKTPDEVLALIRLKAELRIPDRLQESLLKACQRLVEFNERDYKAESIQGDYEEFAKWTYRVVLRAHRKSLEGEGYNLELTHLEFGEIKFALRRCINTFGQDPDSWEADDAVYTFSKLELEDMGARLEETRELLKLFESFPPHPGIDLMEWFQ